MEVLNQNYASSEEYKPKLFWHAQYTDGSNTDYSKINSKDLIKSKIKTIFILDEEGSVIFTQHYGSGQIPFYRARTVMKEGIGTVDRIHMLGYINANNLYLSHVVYVYESDKRIECGYFNMVGHPFSSLIDFNNHDFVAVE